jgi:hypothetical protein
MLISTPLQPARNRSSQVGIEQKISLTEPTVEKDDYF